MAEKVNTPKDFNVHGLGHLRITNYDGAYFDGQEIGEIIRRAAGLEEGDELDYPGAFAEIVIKVRFARPYLNINGKPARTEPAGAENAPCRLTGDLANIFRLATGI